jgi:hypothetical protein
MMGFADQSSPSLQECTDFVVDGLGLNYRIGPVEVSLLGLLTTDDVKRAVRAVTDADEIDRWASESASKRRKFTSRAAIQYRMWREGRLHSHQLSLAQLTFYLADLGAI